jgi:hypothetical protein
MRNDSTIPAFTSIPANSTVDNIRVVPSTVVNTPMITVGEVLQHQSRPDGWICPNCIHHGGNLNCAMNMFISFVGCYTKDCQAFKEK